MAIPQANYSTRRRALKSILGSIAAASSPLALAQTAQTAQASSAAPDLPSVRLLSTVVAVPPQRLGYNMGENLPGSGVSLWLDYLQINAARQFWQQELWPDLPPPWSEGRLDETRFRAEVAQLRAAPLAVERSGHEQRITAAFGGTLVGQPGHSHSLAELARLGIDLLLPVTHPIAPFPFERRDGSADWFGRWAYWRGVYLNAFYLAHHYGAQRFQLFNEPDHANSLPLTQDDYLRRLQLGADAARTAVADAARLSGRPLTAEISAPVSAGLLVFAARSGRKDERDQQRGWGEMLVAARQAAFPGQTQPGAPLFDRYAVQFYSLKPDEVRDNLALLKRQIGAATQGQGIPITVSEMNVATHSSLLRTDDTLDTPQYHAALGAVAGAYLRGGVDGLYLFRLTQTNNAPGGLVKKNGTHVIDNKDPLKRIIRGTRAAEVGRLVCLAARGADEVLAAPTDLPPDLHLLVTRRRSDGQLRLLLSHLGTQSVNVLLDASALGLPAQVQWVQREVHDTAHGAITRLALVNLRGPVSVTLPAQSTTLLHWSAAAMPAAVPALPLKSAPGSPLWRASTGAAQHAGWLRVKTAADAEAPRILRVLEVDAQARPLRILGHVVTAASAADHWLDWPAAGVGPRYAALADNDARQALLTGVASALMLQSNQA